MKAIVVGDQEVALVNIDGQIHAVDDICSHAECAISDGDIEGNELICPCHGSGFFKSGQNFEGPAPRPLDRFEIALAEDGQLIVDKAKEFRMGPIGEPDEQHPNSILKA